ncbi:MAG TPA: HD domain-containing protein [Nitrospirae bacterium]|nr:HD domain-containing protein [Nitrospirota bacterium]
MIDKERYLKWFKDYGNSFFEDSVEHNKNYQLKIEHTFRVCEHSVNICNSLDIDNSLKDLIWLSSVFHDVGRFPQYKQYRTFKDSISINHGLLSSKIAEKEGILSDFSESDRNILLTALKFHNAYQIPEDICDQRTLLCLKAVRDADKLDIWQVFRDLYSDSHADKPSAVGLGLQEEPTISKAVIESIKSKKVVKLSDVANLNDVKLLQLSWIFDLNFKVSFKVFEERQYLNLIVDTMTARDGVDECMRIVRDYINNCL